MTTDAVAAAPARSRNRLGVVALVLALVVVILPFIAWIVIAIIGAASESSADDAIYVGLLGGFITFAGVMALAAPLGVVAVVLGILSLFRAGSKAPGVVAIIFGVLGSIGLLWLPFVLGELVPGWYPPSASPTTGCSAFRPKLRGVRAEFEAKRGVSLITPRRGATRRRDTGEMLATPH